MLQIGGWLALALAILVIGFLAMPPAAASPAFVRAHRSLIANLACVRAVDPRSRDHALSTMEGMERPLSIGRTALARLRAALPAM